MTIQESALCTSYSDLNTVLFIEQKNWPFTKQISFYVWNNINSITRDEYTVAIFKVKPKQK